jgi:tRNA pseudouridine synthase 10
MESIVCDYLVSKAISILKKYPLCDRCMGRMFARLGMELENRERGRAIKTAIVMCLHERIAKGDEQALELFREIAPNIGEPARGLYKRLFDEDIEERACTICRDSLDRIIPKATVKAFNELKKWDIQKFIVGARVPFETMTTEERIKTEFSLVYSESIRNEVKREIGKKLQEYGLSVDFENPEGVVLIELWKPNVRIQVNPVFYKGRYWKLGRNISQSYWPTKWGVKYDFSVEQATWELKQLMSAEKTVIHAAGREDADARMLGTGRPLVIEVKRPRQRHLPVTKVEEALNEGGKGLVVFKLDGEASRMDVRLYKNELAGIRKLYKALVVSDKPVSDDDLRALEKEFSGRTVKQQTPSRVLHRRADMTRSKKVYRIKNIRVSKNVFYSFIVGEGGLYIKELISGDQGRTTPSYSDVLGGEVQCVDLDVLGVDFSLTQSL